MLERCGIILDSGEAVEVKNIHPDPENCFQIAVEELDRNDVVGTFHTHPSTGPNLSVADYWAFRSYPDLRHYIVSKSGLWCFKVSDGTLCRYENPTLPRFPQGLLP